MTYKIYNNILSKSLLRTIDNAWIPLDPANTDYQEYLTWVAEGNEAEEWNPENDGV
jgi:hypothetical protein